MIIVAASVTVTRVIQTTTVDSLNDTKTLAMAFASPDLSMAVLTANAKAMQTCTHRQRHTSTHRHTNPKFNGTQ